MMRHAFTIRRARTAHQCDAWKGTDAQWRDWSGRRAGKCKAPIAKGDVYFHVAVKGQGNFSMCATCAKEDRLVWLDIPVA